MSNQKENEILKLSHNYLAFIDEVGNSFIHFDLKKYKDRSYFPILTVTALIIPCDTYNKILMPGLDEIKDYFFKDKSIYFHSREIRRKDGIFKILLNNTLYDDFKKQMDNLLDRSSVTIISSSIKVILGNMD